MFATLILAGILYFAKKLPKLPLKEILKISGVGVIAIGTALIFFYGSIKASNVSIGVVCFSMVGFFTAFLEPLINRHRGH